MRILAIHKTGLAPATVGRWKALCDLGIDVALICAARWPEGGNQVRAVDMEATPISVFARRTFPVGFGPYYVHLGSIGRIVRHFEPNIIHIREEVFTVSAGQFLLERALFFSRVPFVFESHQNVRKSYPWPARWFESVGYRLAAGAVAGIPSVVNVLREGGFGGPIEMIPLGGVDLELFQPNGPTIASSGLAPVVGFVGRLHSAKGTDELIKALEGVKCQLWLVGDGPEREALKTLARLHGVETNFVGAVPQEEMPKFLRSMDVLVLPSRTTPRGREQWGRVLTEAMACGTPVIGSTAGEIPWVIGNAGLTYAEGSVETLRSSLQRLLGDRTLYSALKTAGLRRAADFSWGHHADKTARFYRKLLN